MIISQPRGDRERELSWLRGPRMELVDGILFSVLIVGPLVSVIPLVIAFVPLRKYWQGGLCVGALK